MAGTAFGTSQSWSTGKASCTYWAQPPWTVWVIHKSFDGSSQLQIWVDTAVLLSLANQLLLKLLPRERCWCLSAPVSRLSPSVLRVALAAWGWAAGRAELGEGPRSPACPGCRQGWLYLYRGMRLGKETNGAKSTTVGSRLSLLLCIFSSLKHLLLWPTRMSCPYHLSRAAQLPSKWRIGLFNFGSLGYCFPSSNHWGWTWGGEKGKFCIP